MWRGLQASMLDEYESDVESLATAYSHIDPTPSMWDFWEEEQANLSKGSGRRAEVQEASKAGPQ